MSSDDDGIFYPTTDRGLRRDEIPLRPHLQLAADMASGVRLGRENEKVCSAVRCIIANAMLASWQPDAQWVFYSRDNNHYAAVRTLAPAWYTRRAIITAVDLLTTARLIEEQRTAPSPSAGFRSRLRATSSLPTACGARTLTDLAWDDGPPIILRDRDTRKLLDPHTVLTGGELVQFQRMTADVEAHNQFLSKFDVGLQGAHVTITGHLALTGTHVNPLQRRYRRVFNGNLALGGRWYGPWWQGLSADMRQFLTIDGQPTVEVDFAACQLRLLCAKCGRPDPLDGHIRHPDPNVDLYRITGVARDVVKLALLIMINAEDRRSASAALDRELRQRRDRGGPKASEVMGKVEAAYPPLQSFWFTGVGLHLQRIDADICAAIQCRMRDLNHPVLSIHDSFIARRDAEADLRHAMRDCFTATYAAIANG
jgi:hypothetical protein